MSQTKVKRELIDGSLGTDWQSAPKTTNFTAVAGEGYFVDTTSSIVTVTLPTSPSSGDEIVFQDYAGTFATNKIILTSSDKIQGSTNDFQNSTNNATINLVYQNTAKGWTADNLITIIPAFDVDYLVVAGGGGGGGYYRAGGGGAGGLRTSYGVGSVNALTLNPGTSYAVSVGPGGAGASNVDGAKGTNSTFASITSTGGGGGGRYTGGTGSAGGSGGSGGGGGGDGTSSSGAGGAGGAGNEGNYTPAEGYAGGAGATYSVGYQCGGGGGGASAAGQTGGTGATDGDGGDGINSLILSYTNAVNANVGQPLNGTEIWYAGGGGGGSYTSGNDTIPGKGGGGEGTANSNYPGNGAPGTDNTGGGGGGASGEVSPNSGVGGTGGSGVVIIRYPSSRTISNPNGGLTFSTYTETTTTTNDTSVTVFKSGNGNIEFS